MCVSWGGSPGWGMAGTRCASGWSTSWAERPPGHDHAEPEAGLSDAEQANRSIRERLEEMLTQAKPVAHKEPERGLDEAVHRHEEPGWTHGL